MSPSYLLDTSALSAHSLHGPGHAFVSDCIRKGAAACALSVFEFAMFLKTRGVAGDVIATAWTHYRDEMRHIHPVDEPVAALALRLRAEASARLPMADACIAACAAHHGLMLVHADSHFSALPPLLKTVDIRAL